MKKTFRILFLTAVLLTVMVTGALAQNVAPDTMKQVLDIMAVQCQNLNDVYYSAMNGDFSRFDYTKQQFSISISNVNLLLNGNDNGAVRKLQGAYNSLQPNAGSIKNSADICSQVRNDLYQRSLNSSSGSQGVRSYEDCVAAGYRVSGGTCFIGGTPVYDYAGNLIGYYYSDCYDSYGYHQGTCWDCYYGADSQGCRAKP